MTEWSPCMSRNHDGTDLLSTILLSRQLLSGRLVVQWTTRGWNKTRGSTGSLAVRVPASPDHQNLMNINFHISPKSIYFPHLQKNIVFKVGVVWHHRRSNSRRVMIRFHPSKLLCFELWDSFGTTLRQLWHNLGRLEDNFETTLSNFLTTLRQLRDSF